MWIFLPLKYDVISQLRHSYSKGPFCVTWLKYLITCGKSGRCSLSYLQQSCMRILKRLGASDRAFLISGRSVPFPTMYRICKEVKQRYYICIVRIWNYWCTVRTRNYWCIVRIWNYWCIIRNMVTAFRGMHVSPAKHSFAWLPRKCDGRTDRRWTKFFLCAAMLCRQQNKKGSITIRRIAIPSMLVNFSTFAFLLNFSIMK